MRPEEYDETAHPRVYPVQDAITDVIPSEKLALTPPPPEKMVKEK
ncbi:hypothetical protein SAMN05660235_01214 [Sporolituus thermophilus DSM 23256]|uniref:Uncharacterized protein n=1 Tax=Sporolituus thermophilus DSM 23256 TaxID=1123285 RepID=A0A1G7K7J8_9FIRM|nr:hypothetical protein SAMN05660235_01214 [Sporolituus thermophilus DSM 23256]